MSDMMMWNIYDDKYNHNNDNVSDNGVNTKPSEWYIISDYNQEYNYDDNDNTIINDIILLMISN